MNITKKDIIDSYIYYPYSPEYTFSEKEPLSSVGLYGLGGYAMLKTKDYDIKVKFRYEYRSFMLEYDAFISRKSILPFLMRRKIEVSCRDEYEWIIDLVREKVDKIHKEMWNEYNTNKEYDIQKEKEIIEDF